MAMVPFFFDLNVTVWEQLRFGGDDHEFTGEEVVNIEEFRNSNGKRVCDISKDRRVIVISQKGCITQITANPDGTLCVVNLPQAA